MPKNLEIGIPMDQPESWTTRSNLITMRKGLYQRFDNNDSEFSIDVDVRP